MYTELIMKWKLNIYLKLNLCFLENHCFCRLVFGGMIQLFAQPCFWSYSFANVENYLCICISWYFHFALTATESHDQITWGIQSPSGCCKVATSKNFFFSTVKAAASQTFKEFKCCTMWCLSEGNISSDNPPPPPRNLWSLYLVSTFTSYWNVLKQGLC